jgi:hypothetical protein
VRQLLARTHTIQSAVDVPFVGELWSLSIKEQLNLSKRDVNPACNCSGRLRPSSSSTVTTLAHWHESKANGDLLVNPAGAPLPASSHAPYSVIIVNFQEQLLVPTVNAVLSTPSHELINEVLIVDDTSEPPVECVVQSGSCVTLAPRTYHESCLWCEGGAANPLHFLYFLNDVMRCVLCVVCRYLWCV